MVSFILYCILDYDSNQACILNYNHGYSYEEYGKNDYWQMIKKNYSPKHTDTHLDEHTHTSPSYRPKPKGLTNIIHQYFNVCNVKSIKIEMEEKWLSPSFEPNFDEWSLKTIKL